MKPAPIVIAAAFAVWVVCSPVAAQPAASPSGGNATVAPMPQTVVARDAEGRLTLRAVRIADALRIDGRLDEPSYELVEAIGGFVQQEPADGEPTTEKTEAWIFFDNANVYISARLWDSHPERMIANEMRHDSSNLINNEQLTIVIDTFHDRRNGFLFLVNALGGMLEEAFVDERSPSRDWNTVWSAKTGRFDQGWTLEIAIPFKSLRYQPGTEQVWGINMNRIIRWKNERTFLAPIPRSSAQAGVFKVSSAATLVGIEAPPSAKHLELKPYAIGKLTTDRNAQPILTNDPTGNIGFDAKYGVTRGLTADLTVRTDFAQVEEDTQQVNLSRFDLFFPEKREFFLEGQGIFNFGGQTTGGGGDTPTLFFSRQVGIARGRPVPILAGGRLTGKAGAYSVGVVNIQTDDEPLSAARATNFTAVRLRRDVLRRSAIGALFTGRSISTLADGSNEAVGIDGNFAFYQNVRINTYLARTWTPGRHGNDLSYRGQFDYAGDRYGLQAERLAVGEHFNPEVGFVRRLNFEKHFLSLRFSPRPKSGSMMSIRRFSYEARFAYLTTGTTSRLESRDAGAAFRIEFQNSDRLNVDYARLYDVPQRSFRVGNVTIPVGTYAYQQVAASYQLGQQRKVAGTLTLLRGTYYGGDQTGASYAGRVEVTRQVALEPTVSVNWFNYPQNPQGPFTTRLVGTRATLTITPRMFIATLLQYNSTTSAFTNNLRFRWEYQPGSELFIVYTEGRDTRPAGFPVLDNRGLAVKINRLIRM